ncbi:MAG: response regulator [Actinomycetota bacterium]|jgi:DNA-binding response OmpR family regulator|nr:response regulator [Actinomycetota bacterium]
MSKLKVLVADDEPALRKLLKTNMELEGYETLEAANGAEVLESVKRDNPDIILLDIMMPVMDGWEVLTELAANPEYSQKVILVSAKASDDAQLQGWELGADEYITKPFDLDALLERVREVAARSEAESEKRRAEAISELQNL